MSKEIYFKPVKNGKDLSDLERDISSVPFNSFESSKDKKGNPLYRLKDGADKTGIIVVMNQNLLTNTVAIIEKELGV